AHLVPVKDFETGEFDLTEEYESFGAVTEIAGTRIIDELKDGIESLDYKDSHWIVNGEYETKSKVRW
ncbi:MAG: hypothetical protein K0U93_31085, partial [Gammaproteobacteria bacterium]|nr:hypothetical protein [Gammaproteobacteria bacterium]